MPPSVRRIPTFARAPLPALYTNIRVTPRCGKIRGAKGPKMDVRRAPWKVESGPTALDTCLSQGDWASFVTMPRINGFLHTRPFG